jgi:PKD repeat protein
MRKIVYALIFAVGIVPQLCAGAIYYIAPNGNDANSGAISEPWRTISKANATLVAGDTVYFRAGTYGSVDDYIVPARSGSAGNYITYARYQSEVVNIDDVNWGADLNNRSYIRIDGLRFTGVDQCWIHMHEKNTVSEHNIIQNCYFSDLHEAHWAGIWLGWLVEEGGAPPNGEVNYNQILNNEFHAVCSPDGEILQLEGNTRYNIIEGNRFYGGPHAAIGMYAGGGATYGYCEYNIIRNNYIENKWHTGINIYSHSARNLVEGNVIVDCGLDHLNNTCGSDRDRLNPAQTHSCIQVGGPYNIFRRNVMVNNGSFAMDSYSSATAYGSDSNHNRIYHNTFDENYSQAYAVSGETDDLTDNIFKNNIFSFGHEYEVYWDVQVTNRANYFVWNNFFGQTTQKYWPSTGTVAELQSAYPTFWNNNISADPRYVNDAGRDFRLQSASPMIDAGAFLTKTRSAGSGTSIPVEDAGYFTSGWGIAEGDSIQLEGQTQTARVTSVDYSNHVVSVNQSFTWSSGQGIGLAFSGFAPDIGALEGTKPIYSKVGATPTSGMIPLAVSFSSRTIGENLPLTIDWNFGDGSTSQLQNPSHTYSAAGTYNVVFRATDSRGNSESRTITIEAYDTISRLSISAVTGSPAPGAGGTTDPAPGTYPYTLGTTIQIGALNYIDYRFSNWTGELDNSARFQNRTTILMDRDKQIAAHFCAKCGDTNGDLTITPADAQVAFDIYLVRIASPSECQGENADVNCDGTKTAPRITPADAQAIFNKFLGRNDLPSDCSGISRNAAVSSSTLSRRQSLTTALDNTLLATGDELIVPFFLPDLESAIAFGFDLHFPSERLEFVAIEKDDWDKYLRVLDSHLMAPGRLRVGGYKSLADNSKAGLVPIALVFRVMQRTRRRIELSITNMVDDLRDGSLVVGSPIRRPERNRTPK